MLRTTQVDRLKAGVFHGQTLQDHTKLREFELTDEIAMLAKQATAGLTLFSFLCCKTTCLLPAHQPPRLGSIETTSSSHYSISYAYVYPRVRYKLNAVFEYILKVIDPIHPPKVLDIRSVIEELRDGIHA